MTDQADDLRETLDDLHDQLAASGDLDEESRQMLSETLREILTKLTEDRDHSSSAERTSWVGRLRDSIQRFEKSHPNLVRAVDKLARALSNVGI